jgi:hypothetical protein
LEIGEHFVEKCSHVVSRLHGRDAASLSARKL